MKMRNDPPIQRIVRLICLLIFLIMLVACSNTDSSTDTTLPDSSTATPAIDNTQATDTPTPGPTPSPLPIPTFTAYSSDTFTINYPQGWQNNNQDTGNAQTFEVEPGAYAQYGNTGFAITVYLPVSNPNIDDAIKTFSDQLQTQYDSTTPDTSAPASITIGGDSWKQVAIIGTQSGVKTRTRILADRHPANNRVYVILIGDGTTFFDQDNANVFQPMLRSFQFKP